jgi:hypothetical protein
MAELMNGLHAEPGDDECENNDRTAAQRIGGRHADRSSPRNRRAAAVGLVRRSLAFCWPNLFQRLAEVVVAQLLDKVGSSPPPPHTAERRHRARLPRDSRRRTILDNCRQSTGHLRTIRRFWHSAGRASLFCGGPLGLEMEFNQLVHPGRRSLRSLTLGYRVLPRCGKHRYRPSILRAFWRPVARRWTSLSVL